MRYKIYVSISKTTNADVILSAISFLKKKFTLAEIDWWDPTRAYDKESIKENDFHILLSDGGIIGRGAYLESNYFLKDNRSTMMYFRKADQSWQFYNYSLTIGNTTNYSKYADVSFGGNETNFYTKLIEYNEIRVISDKDYFTAEEFKQGPYSDLTKYESGVALEKSNTLIIEDKIFVPKNNLLLAYFTLT